MRNERKTWRSIGPMAALLLTVTASAAPAPWHVWRSTLDGARFCAQTSPGPGWTYAAGPFTDLHCRRPARTRADALTPPPGPSDTVTVDPNQASRRSASKSPTGH